MESGIICTVLLTFILINFKVNDLPVCVKNE